MCGSGRTRHCEIPGMCGMQTRLPKGHKVIKRLKMWIIYVMQGLVTIKRGEKKKMCFRPGSNRGPCACEAHVITATLRKP